MVLIDIEEEIHEDIKKLIEKDSIEYPSIRVVASKILRREIKKIKRELDESIKKTLE